MHLQKTFLIALFDFFITFFFKQKPKQEIKP